MPSDRSTKQFVLLPARGLRATGSLATASSASFLMTVAEGLDPSLAVRVGAAPNPGLRVIDSIHEDGAKLVEATPEAAIRLRAHQPALRLVPVVFYRPAVSAHVSANSPPISLGRKVAPAVTIRVVSEVRGLGLPGCEVVAFTDFAHRHGAQGKTNRSGKVSLALPAGRRVERLYVYPPPTGYWGHLGRNLRLTSGLEVGLRAIDLGQADALRHFYGDSSGQSGAGVTVGIVDTGVDTAHPDLTVDGGENTVPGENPTEFGPNGLAHGTHVAGIVGAHGTLPQGLRGVAPAVRLRSYRVFGKGQPKASNYAIAKAIDRAVADGCDLINLSLGAGSADEALSAAIEDARGQGALCIIASGNDHRSPVCFPASELLSLAVCAVGRRGTFPVDSIESGDVAAPYGTDRKNFVAAFANIGPQIDLTGPGVGIVSTVPGGYGPLSGTSMACPAATGAAARLLGSRADLLSMPRDQARSEAMAKVIFTSARKLGFAPSYEGHGLPR